MAAERHVGTPECLNETCTCGMPKPEEWEPALKERRERIATAVLAGIMADPGHVTGTVNGHITPEQWNASKAVKMADALIVELDK